MSFYKKFTHKSSENKYFLESPENSWSGLQRFGAPIVRFQSRPCSGATKDRTKSQICPESAQLKAPKNELFKKKSHIKVQRNIYFWRHRGKKSSKVFPKQSQGGWCARRRNGAYLISARAFETKKRKKIENPTANEPLLGLIGAKKSVWPHWRVVKQIISWYQRWTFFCRLHFWEISFRPFRSKKRGGNPKKIREVEPESTFRNFVIQNFEIRVWKLSLSPQIDPKSILQWKMAFLVSQILCDVGSASWWPSISVIFWRWKYTYFMGGKCSVWSLQICSFQKNFTNEIPSYKMSFVTTFFLRFEKSTPKNLWGVEIFLKREV